LKSSDNQDPRFNFQHTLLLLIFFFSGTAGLIYEVVWMRRLGLSFGTAVAAVTLVLVSYMTGLGLGGRFFGRMADRIKNPRRLFAILELGIAGSAILVSLILGKLAMIYRVLYWALAGQPVLSMILMFIMTAGILFVPTFLMGGTLPVISKICIGNKTGLGRGVGLLYGFNTLGGVLGALAAGFFTIPAWGLSASILIAAGINSLLAFLTVIADPGLKPDAVRVTPQAGTDNAPALRPRLLALAVGAGLSGMAYEILWFRALAVNLSNSVYSFTTILIVFLTGLGLGSWLFGKLIDRVKKPVRFLAAVQILIAAATLLTAVFLSRLPVLLMPLAGWLALPELRVFLPGLVLGIVVMLVPTVLMGINFPLLVKIYNHDPNRVGTGIGRLYFFNTLGSMTGPLVATFFLIPVLGVVKGICAVSFMNLGFGTLFFAHDRPRSSRTRFALTQVPIYAAAVVLSIAAGTNSRLLPPSIFRTPGRHDRVLYYRETAAGSVVASEDLNTGIRACYVNNSPVCGTTYDALKVVKMLGHLPFLVNPAARQVLVVGFGIGITTAALARHDAGSIDCVEICPGVKDASVFFAAFNRYVFRNPSLNFIPGDGRNVLLLSRKKYDVISCDPTHPTLGCGHLYTREYFELYRQRLNPGGVVSQYLPLHKLTPDEFRSLVGTFASVFPHTSVWLGHAHGILLGSDRELKIDFQSLRDFVARTGDDIIDDPYLLATSLILDEKAVAEFVRDAPLHTDDRPFLEFFDPLSLKGENWELNLTQLMAWQSDPGLTIAGIPADTLERYRIGQKRFIAGLIAKSRGDIRAMIASYEKGLVENPENREIRLFLEDEIRQLRYYRGGKK